MDAADIRQFYAACDAAHRELFSTLIHEWEQAGLPWTWNDEGNVALCARTVMRNSRPVLFVLESGAGGRREAISLRLDVWHEALGHADADRFLNAMKGTDGLKYLERDGEIVMVEPGHASGPVQHEVRRRIQTLALRLRDLIGL
ncbi:MAG TPA: hypothetical protein VNH42_05470 [Mariprofundaceae bacterium]|nr:hypothetical protein [Mariprofundaceae bacterium]